MKLLTLLILGLAALTSAQIPGFTGCPDYSPMDGFDMDKFAGKWFESQRYFQVLEVGTRCVATEYKKLSDGKFIVFNEMITRLTGIKRVMEGELKNVGRGGEAKLSVKYSNFPVSFASEYSILDSDYENYAIAWSCNSIGPFSSTHAWVMTRKRNPTEAVLQRAYGVLDKFGISRNFFVRSDQTNCDLDEPSAAANTPVKAPTDSFTAAAEAAVAPIAALPAPAQAAASPASAATTAKVAPTVPMPPLPLVVAAAAAAPPASVEAEDPTKIVKSSETVVKN